MYPTLLRIGEFEITTFGLIMFLAFVVASAVLTKTLRRYGLDPELGSTLTVCGAIGGILGAKTYYAILFHDLSALFSRAGLVWYGGLIGGWIACTIVAIRRKLPYFTVADAAAPALAIGYGVGRLACFFVGDDYGRPTSGAIGIAFPKGTPPTTAEALRAAGASVDPSLAPDTLLRVHPTQLYEVAAGLTIFAILMWRQRRASQRGSQFGLFLILLGVERFLVEFVRVKDDRFFGPFTLAQLISVILIGIGTSLMLRRASLPPVAAGVST
jgi:phosphatidylglycerol:prolipoprotein diacylglycerol transferase